jgi:phosphohistidine phosphatase SixA
MSSDVPLSPAGLARANALRDTLLSRKITRIYSTPTIRTTGTAQPLSAATGTPIISYKAGDTTFPDRLRRARGHILIVGHSNTVDELVNGLLQKKVLNDLPDTQYGDLFIIHRKGKRMSLEQIRVGK